MLVSGASPARISFQSGTRERVRQSTDKPQREAAV